MLIFEQIIDQTPIQGAARGVQSEGPRATIKCKTPKENREISSLKRILPYLRSPEHEGGVEEGPVPPFMRIRDVEHEGDCVMGCHVFSEGRPRYNSNSKNRHSVKGRGR